MSTLNCWLKHWVMYEQNAVWCTERLKHVLAKKRIPLCSFFKFPSLHRLYLWVVVGHEKTPPLNRLWNGYRNNNVPPPHAFKKRKKKMLCCVILLLAGLLKWLEVVCRSDWHEIEIKVTHFTATRRRHYFLGIIMAMIFNVTLHSFLAPYSLNKRK